jgi:uncharacterized protein YerC
MRAVFEKYQRERDETVMFETLKTAEKIAEMLKRNIDLETISKETGFSINHIKIVQRLLNLQ